MIKTLSISNFKAFQGANEIEIKPITILAGPNSGGKTSILQSLLLLKQTLEGEADIDLNLDGRFLQFANFNELVFNRPRLRSSEISYEIALESSIPAKVVPRYFPNLEIPEGTESLPLQSKIELSFRYKERKDGRKQVVVNRFGMSSQIYNLPGPLLLARFRNKRYEVRKLQGIKLPKSFKKGKTIQIAGNNFVPSHFILEQETEEEKRRMAGEIIVLDSIFRFPLAVLQAELKENLRYLGPLREEPQRAYLHSGRPYPEIGQKGEFAAQILWLEKDEIISYRPTLNQELRRLKLIDAFNDSFQRLGITEWVDVKSAKSIMYQILFGLKGPEGRKQVTIADVGFGVSQLLPVVVMTLRSSRSSLLLFEQPEIHLHPKLQANLADFFLTAALSGKRLLIETHSDHLINRLRRRIAEDETDRLKEKVSILFVRPPSDGKGATIEPLQVDRYGVVENWPPDFLPESADEAEAIFRAGLEKRKEK